MGITDRSRAGVSKAYQHKLDAYKAAKAKSPESSKTKVTKADVDKAYDAWQAAKEILDECDPNDYNMHWQEAHRRSVIWETLKNKLAKGE